ncbi:hypothetical protein B0H11DRAFT_2204716, partial [Mycena galericulata]
MSGTIGRPKGSKNKPDHQAGGVRVGSGPKRQGPGQASGSTNLQTTTASTQPHTAPVRPSKIIKGNGIANLAPMFRPKLTQKPDSVTQGSVQIDSNTEAIHPPSAVPFPFLPPSHEQVDLGSDSEPDSDFEDLLDEAVPSKSLPEEASINTDGVISLYLTGIKTKLVAEMASGKWPKCYEAGSFWIHPPAPIFALQKSLKPADLYYPSVFIWFPHLMKFGTILTCQNKECPHFKSTHRPLEIKGYNDKPLARRVVSLDRVYYVMTNRIHCKVKDNTGC